MKKKAKGNDMKKEIKITKKDRVRGDDGYKTFSIRIKDSTVDKLDGIAAKTNRSRNEIINILLESAIDIVKTEEN